MKTMLAAALALSVTLSGAKAESWTSYRIAETGTSVDVPVSVFTELAGKPDGYGQQFRSSDGRADLTVQAVSNRQGLSPAAFLARKNPPSGIIYQRITPRFFVVSSIKRDKIWYNRCNFSRGYVHCVLINYPAAEKRQWDRIVTRISHSLSAG
ncbi:hypothetical protein C7U92_18105 [Bradyrhizobium sp. WBOS7]|uniref:Uncharacterized protein n=1 Tax=Bradyrhizobium betae TaxID=244734 RepID=A0AAE9SPD6_9BRAD|nr:MULTISPECIES: hypothetical protein [Bradyrhizobium]MDD1572707.1 hypothetical protein [Bradyrhizobium sp. WBOS1]UUO33554.1 hypothetical protein DCK84_02485 [Bradyrhizobium sp. WBOS01]MDD1528046.1 hypothetical protein [Bradyrhizobium sp. WBOS2]MDD1578626.1 hypothetical protein [Bradyrhizobium sp. WBOS7]MDD1603188.1 hypothetical protein [Bradyrhizobium sp. WBOS16]